MYAEKIWSWLDEKETSEEQYNSLDTLYNCAQHPYLTSKDLQYNMDFITFTGGVIDPILIFNKNCELSFLLQDSEEDTSLLSSDESSD